MQELAVAIIVALAALYLGAKYLPAGLRQRLAAHLARGGRASWLARWLGAGSGCGSGGGCNSCGSDAQPAPPAGKHRVIKLHQRR